jgi:hypothetical protein
VLLRTLQDSLSAPDCEGDALLEGIVEVVGLPVLDVVGVLQLSVDVDVDVFQEAEVELLANDILVVLLEMYKTSVVGFLECPEEVVTDVICVVLRGTNSDLLAIMCNGVAPVVFLSRFPSLRADAKTEVREAARARRTEMDLMAPNDHGQSRMQILSKPIYSCFLLSVIELPRLGCSWLHTDSV